MKPSPRQGRVADPASRHRRATVQGWAPHRGIPSNMDPRTGRVSDGGTESRLDGNLRFVIRAAEHGERTATRAVPGEDTDRSPQEIRPQAPGADPGPAESVGSDPADLREDDRGRSGPRAAASPGRQEAARRARWAAASPAPPGGAGREGSAPGRRARTAAGSRWAHPAGPAPGADRASSVDPVPSALRIGVGMPFRVAARVCPAGPAGRDRDGAPLLSKFA